MKSHNLKGKKTQLGNKPKPIAIHLLDKNKQTKHTHTKKKLLTPIRQIRTGKEGMASTDSD